MIKPPVTMETVLSLPGSQGLAARPFATAAVEAASEREYDEMRTRRAWEAFLTSGYLDPGETLVRATIRRSWERSVTQGVDARGRGSPEITSEDRLQQLREANEDLLGSAQVAFQQVTEILSKAGTMAVITDRNGVILDVGGNRQTVDDAHDIRLQLGAAWGESVAGTNGIGTALVTGQLVHVHAAEHFCEGVKAWACMGAPIRDPVDGSIIGLIDLSGPQNLFSRHSVALAMMSALQIERALTEQTAGERIRLLEASLERLHRPSTTDGMVVLDRYGRILHFNEQAARCWSRFESAPSLTLRERLVGGETPLNLEDLADRLPEVLRGHHIEPLMIDGSVRGAMLVLKGKPRQVAPVLQASAVNPAVATARQRIVGESELLVQAVDRVIRAARGKTAILLEGETGVGKELFAQLAHAVGKVTGKEPFVALNCGAISKELLGDELFGHAPGAFTGATREGRAGRFEHAHGGTLSLDEIGEMPLDLQPYLLRVLEERAVYRLGESKPRPIDVRLVASTNRNLRQEVEEGRFRRDLYYRIGVVRITVPPLRQRTGDIPLLLDHYNMQLSAHHERPPLRFEPTVRSFLESYEWPGNIRELRNLIEGLVLMSVSDEVGFADLPEEMLHPAEGKPQWLPMASAKELSAPIARLQDAERHAIERAITEAGGNVSVAADRLGVARSTVYRKLHQYRGHGS